MDFEHLMEVQSVLNDFTLSEKGVYVIDSQFPGTVVPNIIEARMSLRRRDGEFLRHQSGFIRLCDMYQWAGNREFLELKECLDDLESNLPQEEIDKLIANARIEVVDIMHFDLSLLALTCTEDGEIQELLRRDLLSTFDTLTFARSKVDDLQLGKWWTSNKVNAVTIREHAVIQFVTLLLFACNEQLPLYDDELTDKPLFESLEDVVDTYKKKVEVNYERVKADYDHVTDAEMGNETIK